ncbi:MAG: hypothetical protein ACC656_15345, partial [Candidatus Heimdallarchaeota archaeon]
MGRKNYYISIVLIVSFVQITLFPYYTQGNNNSSFLTLNNDQDQVSSVNVLAIRQPDNDMDGLKEQLSSNYLNYGEIKINIDSTTAASDTITLSLLESTQSDVLFLANLFSGDNLLSEEEITAIIQYVEQGHSIVGSHGTLEPYTQANLAPYFGINSDMIASTGSNMPIVGFSQVFDLSLSLHPIFMNVNEVYETKSPATMAAILNSQEEVWSERDEIILNRGKIIATSTDLKAAIIISESVNFRSVYLTHYPSQNPTTDDVQLLYNAFLWSDWVTHEVIISEDSEVNPTNQGFEPIDQTINSSSPTPNLDLNYDG